MICYIYKSRNFKDVNAERVQRDFCFSYNAEGVVYVNEIYALSKSHVVINRDLVVEM